MSKCGGKGLTSRYPTPKWKENFKIILGMGTIITFFGISILIPTIILTDCGKDVIDIPIVFLSYGGCTILFSLLYALYCNITDEE